MKFGLALLVILTPACISTRTVGITELELAEPHSKPIVCLNERNGTTGQITRGTVAGRPGVNVTFGVGANFTLDQRTEVEGGAAYGGELCLHDGQVCDHVLVVERGGDTFVLYRNHYSEQPLPASPSAQAIVDQAAREGVLGRLADIKLNPATRVAFAALADARETSAWIRLAGVVASAGIMTAGEYTGDQSMMEAGRDSGMDIARMDLSEAERPLITAFPGLIPILRFGQMMCIEGKPPK